MKPRRDDLHPGHRWRFLADDPWNPALDMIEPGQDEMSHRADDSGAQLRVDGDERDEEASLQPISRLGM